MSVHFGRMSRLFLELRHAFSGNANVSELCESLHMVAKIVIPGTLIDPLTASGPFRI